MALIRYPGSKEKLSDALYAMFPDQIRHCLWATATCWEYREPFFGAGAVGFKVLRNLDFRSSVWLNDIDEDLVCLWRSVQSNPYQLCKLVRAFTPSVEAFYDFKERDGTPGDPVERGFRKLALHRMSVSGFGVKSGGPIGGRGQNTSEYTVECRWNSSSILKGIKRLNELMSRFRTPIRITCGDFEELIVGGGSETFIYLDPPYYEKGGQLYKYPMSDDDHRRLSGALRESESQWVLSYDDHQTIRELYSWADFHELEITYMNAVTKSARPKNREIAIVPK